MIKRQAHKGREVNGMELDEILQEFDKAHPDADVDDVGWEGWPKITADDLRDYQGR